MGQLIEESSQILLVGLPVSLGVVDLLLAEAGLVLTRLGTPAAGVWVAPFLLGRHLDAARCLAG